MTHNALVAQPTDLTRYLEEIARYPLLTKEEEFALAVRVHDDHDVEAARTLVLANLRFVVKVAKEYARFALPLLDLIQEGNIGLMHAVKRFDPYRGFRLLTYAVHWIRSFMKEYIIRNWSMVKVASARVQKKLFFQLIHLDTHADGVEEAEAYRRLAEDSEVQEEIARAAAQRVRHRDLSLDLPSAHEDGDGATLLEFLPSEAEAPDEQCGREDLDERVRQVVEELRPSLNERQRYILDHRLMTDEPMSLAAIGERYGVSRERVRQIEAKLKRRLATALAPLAPALAAG